ncbi:MAG: DUF4418 family protein [Synergistaceae bacterium]|jgi:hypothetical protein|nr:DUF4418 family protein [Synergistaceae bacterium]
MPAADIAKGRKNCTNGDNDTAGPKKVSLNLFVLFRGFHRFITFSARGIILKNRIISGVGAIIAGLLISLGPRFLFKLCPPMAGGRWMTCHWTGQGEIGVGALIAILGCLMIFFSDNKVRLGLSVAVFLSGILALLLPVLIGGCVMETMSCRSVTFPALTVISILTVAGFAANAVYLRRARH